MQELMLMSIEHILDCLNDPSADHYCEIMRIIHPEKNFDVS